MTTDRNEDEWLNDPFLDATTDVSNLTPEQKRKFRAKVGIPEPRQHDELGDLNPYVISNAKQEYQDMLRDPAVRAELAQRDPKFAEQYQAEQIEAVVAEFRERNPEYLETARNAAAVIQPLARKYLRKYSLDEQEAGEELYRAGHWTVKNLEAQYKACLKAGTLDVPKGHTKQLTDQEKLEVLAILRGGDDEGAVLRYLDLAFGGSIPQQGIRTPQQLMARYPDAFNEAAVFVWVNSRTDVTPDELRDFQREKLAQIPLLSIMLISQAWHEWNKGRHTAKMQGAVDRFRRTQQEEDLDSLSDAEIDRRLQQARREAMRVRL